MSDQSIESDVRDFYEQASLSPQRVNALHEATQLVKSKHRWQRAAVASLIGLAAMTLIAVGLYVNSSDSAPVITTDNASSTQLTPPRESSTNGAKTNTNQVEYQLVAFRSHGNECPHCRATGEVFAELSDELHDDDISLKQFDMRLPQDRVRADELGLSGLVEERIETAFFALVNRNGGLIQEFKPSMKSDRIARSVRDAMKMRIDAR